MRGDLIRDGAGHGYGVTEGDIAFGTGRSHEYGSAEDERGPVMRLLRGDRR